MFSLAFFDVQKNKKEERVLGEKEQKIKLRNLEFFSKIKKFKEKEKIYNHFSKQFFEVIPFLYDLSFLQQTNNSKVFFLLERNFSKKIQKKFFFHRNTAKDIFDDFRQKIKKKIMMLSKFKI